MKPAPVRLRRGRFCLVPVKGERPPLRRGAPHPSAALRGTASATFPQGKVDRATGRRNEKRNDQMGQGRNTYLSFPRGKLARSD